MTLIVEFRKALSDLNLAKVKECIAQDATLATKAIDDDNNGHTALHQIVSFSNNDNATQIAKRVEIIKLLLAQGASVHAQNNDGFLPIHFACIYGNLEVVKVIAEVDSDNTINFRNHKNRTPISFAAETSNAEILEYLAGEGASLTEGYNKGDKPIIMRAAENHYSAAKNIEALANLGADVNELTHDGRSALYPLLQLYDGHHNRVDGLKMLQKYGFDFSQEFKHYNGSEYETCSALDYVMIRNYQNPEALEIAKFFIEEAGVVPTLEFAKTLPLETELGIYYMKEAATAKLTALHVDDVTTGSAAAAAAAYHTDDASLASHDGEEDLSFAMATQAAAGYVEAAPQGTVEVLGAGGTMHLSVTDAEPV